MDHRDFAAQLRRTDQALGANEPAPAPQGARQIIYCRQCLMPNSRPRITFTADGVCNGCVNAANKPVVDWAARRAEFVELLARHRGRGPYDCIVPWSGGKDSSSIAYRLKFEFGVNPLLVTFSPMMPTAVGNANRESLLRLGFDHVFLRANPKVHRRLARRFFIERGNPKVAWDAGVGVAPVQVAVKYGIPLVFYAEHGDSEYGGKLLRPDANKIRSLAEVLEHYIGDDPRNWVDDEIAPRDLAPYLYPAAAEVQQVGVTAYYFAWFFRWSMFENYKYITAKLPFQTCAAGRTIGTFTDFDSVDDQIDDLYYYMQYIKFGFGRCIRDASRFIQNGHLTREEGLALARRYDGEFPSRWFDEVLEYLGMTKDEFTATVDQHRNSEIWQKTETGWALRFPVV